MDTPGGCAAIQTNLRRLEKWDNMDLMQVNKVKCKILHIGRNNSTYEYMLGYKWLESSLGKKDPGVLCDSKLTTSQ